MANTNTYVHLRGEKHFTVRVRRVENINPEPYEELWIGDNLSIFVDAEQIKLLRDELTAYLEKRAAAEAEDAAERAGEAAAERWEASPEGMEARCPARE